MAPYFRFNIPCAITTTTTTTTTTAPPCYCYTIIAENGTTTISYSRCNDGATVNLEVLSAETAYVCSRDTPIYVSGAIPTIIACSSTVNCTENVNCNGCT
jgi:hypothetical protein